MKDLAVYLAGVVLYLPSLFLCSNSMFCALFAVVWCIVVYNAPKYSNRLRKFWREFHKVNIKFLNKISEDK